jgi:hypothetical protein
MLTRTYTSRLFLIVLVCLCLGFVFAANPARAATASVTSHTVSYGVTDSVAFGWSASVQMGGSYSYMGTALPTYYDSSGTNTIASGYTFTPITGGGFLPQTNNPTTGNVNTSPGALSMFRMNKPAGAVYVRWHYKITVLAKDVGGTVVATGIWEDTNDSGLVTL